MAACRRFSNRARKTYFLYDLGRASIADWLTELIDAETRRGREASAVGVGVGAIEAGAESGIRHIANFAETQRGSGPHQCTQRAGGLRTQR